MLAIERWGVKVFRAHRSWFAYGFSHQHWLVCQVLENGCNDDLQWVFSNAPTERRDNGPMNGSAVWAAAKAVSVPEEGDAGQELHLTPLIWSWVRVLVAMHHVSGLLTLDAIDGERKLVTQVVSSHHFPACTAFRPALSWHASTQGAGDPGQTTRVSQEPASQFEKLRLCDLKPRG